MKLSLVVPCYNEEENVAAFQKAVMHAFQGCGYAYEIIYVDDGSSDQTLPELEKLYEEMKEQGVGVVGMVLDTVGDDGSVNDEAVKKHRF